MEYRRDDQRIKGFWINEEFVCLDCMEDEELEELATQKTLIENKENQMEYVCVRCKRKL